MVQIQNEYSPMVIGSPGAGFRSTSLRHHDDTRLRVAGLESMQEALGTGYEVIEAGLNGRTADLPDPTLPQISGSGLDGSADLPATLATHLPLDLVLIMLGTNDLKAMFDRSPFRIALGCAQPDSRSQSRNNLVSQCRESWTDHSAGYFLSRTEW
jgi:lysophospholipase L1-like esterase